MTAGFFQAPTSNFWSTSLNGAISSGVTTITLNSTTGLQAPGYLVIDREDSTGTATPNAREVIKFTGIVGNGLTGVTRGADNSTARSHADGALVEATFTVGMVNDPYNAITAEHAADGTHAIIAAATITAVNIANARMAAASVITFNANALTVNNPPAGIMGHFYWSRTGALATVLNTTAKDTHFALQRATQNLTLKSYWGSLLSAPSLTPAEFDISWSSGPTGTFTSIFSTRPFIDIGEYTSTSGATPGTLSLTSLASGIVLRHEFRMPGGAGGYMAQLQAVSR